MRVAQFVNIMRPTQEVSVALIDTLLQELDAEAPTTRRVLERVPDDRLTWRPHPKSRPLGALAMHIAHLPGQVAELAVRTRVEVFQPLDEAPARASALIAALDDSPAKATRLLAGMDDVTVMSAWQMVQGDRVLFSVTRFQLLRAALLNHWYHHRGQSTVYLRERDVALPAIYGPSADEAFVG